MDFYVFYSFSLQKILFFSYVIESSFLWLDHSDSEFFNCLLIGATDEYCPLYLYKGGHKEKADNLQARTGLYVIV